VTNSRIKFSKIAFFPSFQATKKLKLGADSKVRISRRGFHCRDKIEFQSEVPEVEELKPYSEHPRLSCGTSTLAIRVRWSTRILNYFQFSLLTGIGVSAFCKSHW